MSESVDLLQEYPQSFVHLHLHTQYSLLDGAIRPGELFERAKELGMPAVGISDHGNAFGAIDFYTKASAAGIKPVLGAEVYFTTGSRFDRISPRRGQALSTQDEMESRHRIHHLVLLCKNNQGYANLCQLISKAYLEGFYYKPRTDIELLKQYSEGIIASTACLKGEVGFNFYLNRDEQSHQAIHRLREIYGDDLYLEIQHNGIPEQEVVNKKVISFAQESGLPLLATNDCHYLRREDAAAHEVLLCIQTGKLLSDQNRMKLSTDEFYFKSPQEMRANFKDVPEACDNSLRIAQMCNLDLRWTDDKGQQIYHLPDFEIETKEDVQGYFSRVSREGLERRFNGHHFKNIIKRSDWEQQQKPIYLKRLEDEIKMIGDMGFPGYFLIVSDFILWAKERNIPVGPGRGSGAGSLVAYALDITNIDPIPFDLLFERFINPERISMPDFDVDFCQNRRQEVIDYVTNKYGSERVGQIITFGKLQAKAAFKDVARVYDLPFAESNIISKLIPNELDITLARALEVEPKLNELIDKDPKIKRIFEIAQKLEGLLRHASTHAAGVVITNRPLVEHCPLFRGKEGEQVVQFDKDICELTGLVKFDFLGLKTLTVIQQASDFIRRDLDPDFDIEAINLREPEIYQYISGGNTIGVFQLESAGMIELCQRIGPESLDDVTAINALYRPGPLESGMVDDFIDIKHGRKEMTFPFPELEPVLKDTYGVIVYQEQVMNIARIVAGYSLGQADMLRKAMGKKKISEMDRHREIFLKGAKERNFDVDRAASLYELMANFAAYGFNKSHAVAYALIAYQTAYLKFHYPAPFYAGLLSCELSNTDKVKIYISDAKQCGVEVLPPDINQSIWLFNVVDSDIRFGMGAIKNVGSGAVEEIIRVREGKNGPYQGLIDFCQRVPYQSVNRRAMESMIKVGVFDQCEEMNRRTMLEHLELILAYGRKTQEEALSGQSSLFDMVESQDMIQPKAQLGIVDLEEFEQNQILAYEAELMGIYVSGHPLERFVKVIEQLSSMDIAAAMELPGHNKREMVLAGLISSMKITMTRKGDQMAFAVLEDLSSKIEMVIFPKVFEQYREMLETDEPVVVVGTVNLQEDPRKLFPERIQLLSEQTEERVCAVRLELEMADLSNRKLERLKEVILSYRGTVPIQLVFDNGVGRARMPLTSEYLISATPQMAARVNELLQRDAVKFIVDSSGARECG